jgi:hypothetical protein
VHFAHTKKCCRDEAERQPKFNELAANIAHGVSNSVPLSRSIAPGPETRLKLIAADYDGMAMRAAALDLQQADELARAFAKSNTKRLIGSADLIRSPDTSRSSL